MTNHFGDNLVKKIRDTQSFLCLGIDPHLDLIPNIFDLQNNSSNIISKVEKFCFSLLDSAKGLVPAIKPQIALFEQLDPDGMQLLASLCKYAQSLKEQSLSSIIETKAILKSFMQEDIVKSRSMETAAMKKLFGSEDNLKAVEKFFARKNS